MPCWAQEAAGLLGVGRYGLRCRDLAATRGHRADQVSRWAGQASRRRAHGEASTKRLDALDTAIASAPIDA